MRKLKYVILVILSLLTISSLSQDWKIYEDKVNSVRIKFPGEFRVVSRTFDNYIAYEVTCEQNTGVFTTTWKRTYKLIYHVYPYKVTSKTKSEIINLDDLNNERFHKETSKYIGGCDVSAKGIKDNLIVMMKAYTKTIDTDSTIINEFMNSFEVSSNNSRRFFVSKLTKANILKDSAFSAKICIYRLPKMLSAAIPMYMQINDEIIGHLNINESIIYTVYKPGIYNVTSSEPFYGLHSLDVNEEKNYYLQLNAASKDRFTENNLISDKFNAPGKITYYPGNLPNSKLFRLRYPESANISKIKSYELDVNKNLYYFSNINMLTLGNFSKTYHKITLANRYFSLSKDKFDNESSILESAVLYYPYFTGNIVLYKEALDKLDELNKFKESFYKKDGSFNEKRFKVSHSTYSTIESNHMISTLPLLFANYPDSIKKEVSIMEYFINKASTGRFFESWGSAMIFSKVLSAPENLYKLISKINKSDVINNELYTLDYLYDLEAAKSSLELAENLNFEVHYLSSLENKVEEIKNFEELSGDNTKACEEFMLKYPNSPQNDLIKEVCGKYFTYDSIFWAQPDTNSFRNLLNWMPEKYHKDFFTYFSDASFKELANLSSEEQLSWLYNWALYSGYDLNNVFQLNFYLRVLNSLSNHLEEDGKLSNSSFLDLSIMYLFHHYVSLLNIGETINYQTVSIGFIPSYFDNLYEYYDPDYTNLFPVHKMVSKKMFDSFCNTYDPVNTDLFTRLFDIESDDTIKNSNSIAFPDEEYIHRVSTNLNSIFNNKIYKTNISSYLTLFPNKVFMENMVDCQLSDLLYLPQYLAKNKENAFSMANSRLKQNCDINKKNRALLVLALLKTPSNLVASEAFDENNPYYLYYQATFSNVDDNSKIEHLLNLVKKNNADAITLYFQYLIQNSTQDKGFYTSILHKIASNSRALVNHPFLMDYYKTLDLKSKYEIINTALDAESYRYWNTGSIFYEIYLNERKITKEYIDSVMRSGNLNKKFVLSGHLMKNNDTEYYQKIRQFLLYYSFNDNDKIYLESYKTKSGKRLSDSEFLQSLHENYIDNVKYFPIMLQRELISKYYQSYPFSLLCGVWILNNYNKETEGEYASKLIHKITSKDTFSTIVMSILRNYYLDLGNEEIIEKQISRYTTGSYINQLAGFNKLVKKLNNLPEFEKILLDM